MVESLTRKLDKNQRVVAIFMIALLLMQTFLMAFTPHKASAASYPGKVTYDGQAISGPYIVGKFRVDGKLAFCMDHDKLTPATGYPMSQGSIYQNDSIRAILYYGAGGPGSNMPINDRTIVATSLALDVYANYGGNHDKYGLAKNIPEYNTLLNHGKNKDAPDRSVGFSNANLNTSISGNIQKSQTTTFKADPNNSIKINVPSGVTLVNESTGSKTTGGTATIKGGEKIHFEANLSYGQKYNTGKIKGSIGEYQPIVYMPQGSNSSGYQRLVHGIETDPVQTTELTVNFQASEGWIEITKNGNDTNSALSGATFQIKDGNTVVDTVTTGSNGKVKTKALLPNKTYTVVETKAPNGYTLNKTSKNVKVEAGKTVATSFTNEAVLGEISITKQDAETGNTPQGTGTFTGAEFQIKDSSGKVVDTLKITSGNKVTSKKLPLGKYTVVETKAPNGYLINKTPQSVTLSYKDQNTALVSSSTTIKDEAVKGEIEIVKQDAETGNTPQGTGTFTGAEFQIKDSSGKVVDTLTIKDGNKVKSKKLPLGEYVVVESKAPNGYLINTSEHKVSLTYKDQNTSLVATSTTVKNEAVKGKIEIVKKDDDNKFIEGVVYEIKDSNGKVVDTVTTGKDGKAVSKELVLGHYSVVEKSVPAPLIIDRTPIPVELKYKDQTTKLVSSRVDQTNKNAKGEIELVKVDYKNFQGVDGALYGLYTPSGDLVQEQTTKDGGKAIFKDIRLGSYYVQEIKAPAGYILDTKKYHVTLAYVDQDTPVILAAVDVEQRREPVIGTTASFVGLDKTNPNMTTLVDVVKYENLIMDREYTVEGHLMDKKTGEPILIDGKKVTGSTTFVAKSIDGEVEVKFTFDQSKLKTETVVVFEDLYHEETLIAVHHDINDKEQTVELPSIGTTASFVELDKKNPDMTTLVDVVKYKNLIVGKNYEVTGKLMDKATGKPIVIDGKEVTGKTKFKAEKPNGSVEVTFTFDQSKLKTDTVVVFEDLYSGNTLIAVHHDINDKEQTVEIPEVKTEASFVELDKKDPNMTTLVDIVKYDNLIVGKEYTVTGKLMDKATGKAIVIDGKEVTGKTTFKATKANGQVEVKFTFDQSKLKTDTVVVFEDLYNGDRLIAVHHDINDKEQTVEIPEVKTEASFVELDKKDPKMTTLVDIVKYDNLIVGKEYTVTGKLMDKATGKAIVIDGKEVTGKTTFKATKANGQVEVKFTFDQSKLKTDTVVVFEDLYSGDRLIAVHHDINDVEQTVEIPKVKTEASFVELDKKDPKMTTLVDIVKYDNLIVGKEYEVTGKLMDKATGKAILIDGKEVTGKTKFKAEKPNGSVEVKFTFDQSKLETDTVVVFEDLYNGDRLIAVHHDIDDKEQTVEIPGVRTTASFFELDKKDPNMTTLVDVVKYKNLTVGKEYEVTGKLMDKATGKAILIDGKEVTGKTKFKAEKPNGSVEVTFTFDQSKLETDTVVVFEDLYNGKTLVAVHHDIDDVEQTVEIPGVKTEASFVELDKADPNMTTLVDVVKYENLIVGEEYTVTGKLMDKETGEPIIIDEKEVTGSTTFKPTKPDGNVEVTFTFDQTKLQTDTVVVFEDLYNGERLIAVHHDINDKEQTVEIPEVGTTASFVKVEKENPNIATIVDIVKYEKLIPGKEYTVKGILMDKETGEPIQIEDTDIPLTPLEPSTPVGKDLPLTPLEPSTSIEEDEGEVVKTKYITGETTFVADSANGEVEVEFTFDKSKLKTDTVVVFEDLYAGERLIAVHHDINDIEQTVDIPDVKTEASFVELDKKEPNMTTLIDIVHYEGLVVGKEYKVDGHLMNKETNEPILIDGEKVTGSTTFVAEESTGKVEVTFTFDQSKLETDTVVVFEDLYDGENLIAVHHDINDEEQTVDIPEVKTSASFVELDKENPNMTTLVDVVYYNNLLVGEEYTVNGKLMDKETEKPVIIDGKEVTGTTTFIAEKSEGSVEVEFTFDQTKLQTDTVVVFEDLYNGERLIAVHHDINDIEQTVEIPKVKTEASFAERDTEKPNMVTLSDIVKYENLIVGKEYTVNGKLMDKETGKPVIIDGKEVTGTTTFTAKKSEGEVEVLFTFDQSKLKTDTVVVFEDLYDGEKLVAVHHDINDKDQTVGMVKVEVIKKDSKDGKRLEGAEFTMYDKKGKHVLDVQVTDNDGYAYFNIVEGEEVVIKETKAPEGYKINKKQSKQKVVGEGKVITLEIENDKIPDNPLPDTATTIFSMLLIGAGLLLVGGFAGFFYFRKRKLATGVNELDQE